MTGVHGSIIEILTNGFADTTLRGSAPLPSTIEFGKRPAVKDAYPAVIVKSAGTSPPDYHMGGDDLEMRVNKTKAYRLRIEVYAETLDDAEFLGEAIERMLEREAVRNQIASLTAGDADGVEVSDDGNEIYEAEEAWTPFSGRSHRGILFYTVKIRRSF